jgi:hypothetical protein
MYRIVGLGDEELKNLANQQVEVRGVLESADKTATAGTSGPPTSSQPATANPATGTSGTTAAVGTSSGSESGKAGAVPTLRASSIRVVSSSCGGGGTR